MASKNVIHISEISDLVGKDCFDSSTEKCTRYQIFNTAVANPEGYIRIICLKYDNLTRELEKLEIPYKFGKVEDFNALFIKKSFIKGLVEYGSCRNSLKKRK